MAGNKKETKSITELRASFGRPETEYFDTGNFLINSQIGGGFPTGKIIEIHSDAGFGKTTLLGQIFRYIIEKYKVKIAYLDVENAFDLSLREKLGLVKYENDDKNEPSFLYICPNTYEEVVTSLNAVLKMGYLFVGYDSIANTSLDFGDEDVSISKKIGLHSLIQGEVLKSYKGIFARQGKTLVVINQMRANINTKNPMAKGPALRPAGGKVLDHNLDIRFALTKTDWIVNTSNEKIGSKLKLTTVKNKVALPFRQIELDLYFGYGVDKTATLMQVMIDEGFAARAGAYYSVPSIDPDTKYQGKEGLKVHVRENYDKYVELVKGKGVKNVDIQG